MMQTRICPMTGNDTEDLTNLQEAGKVIALGGLVAFPTETVYGLGANALDPAAVNRIFEAKGRPADNPLIVHIADVTQVEQFAHTQPAFYALAQHFMPGPLTVILPKKEVVPDVVTAGMDTVAIRCPNHLVAHQLIAFAGVPIAAPSANCSGRPSPTTAEHVIEDMQGRIEWILDGGSCQVGVESTVVCLEGQRVRVLRPGAVTAEMILERTGFEVVIDSAVLNELQKDEKPLSPGMKYKHYAPKAPLILVKGEKEKVHHFFKEKVGANPRCVIIGYDEDVASLKGDVSQWLSIGTEKDVESHVREIFAKLRQADLLDVDEIYAHLPSSEGLSLALYNRMIRAAAHRIIDLSYPDEKIQK